MSPAWVLVQRPAVERMVCIKFNVDMRIQFIFMKVSLKAFD